MFGFQPPDTARASQSIVVWPAADLTLTDRMQRPPFVAVTAPPATIRAAMPAASASGKLSRMSITAATVAPHACRSRAVRHPSSLMVKTATRLPGATAKRFK
jgi:hypothetical protein